MPIKINNKFDCTGCGACWNVCPKRCITSQSDEEGFPYPQVDTSICINCELCVKVCPILNNFEIKNKDKEVYAAWSHDSETRYMSTSGGAFTELAKVILDRNGIVFGAAYDEDNLVHHISVSQFDDLFKLRQSKYLQSDIEEIYKDIETILKTGCLVLFCGSPCQVAGLKSFLYSKTTGLHTNMDNLYTIDFICRGMNSPKAYKYWLEELEKNFNSKITRVWFKYKKNGWKRSPLCTRVDFGNGGTYVTEDENNSFMMGYLHGNLYLRPSCSACHFKGSDRYSDITLADFWKIDSRYDDDGGTSMVMLNTEKGRNLFDSAKKGLFYFAQDFDEIEKGNVCFNQSVELNPRGREFLMRLGEKPFSKLVNEYTKSPLYKLVIKKAKRFARKIMGEGN